MDMKRIKIAAGHRVYFEGRDRTEGDVIIVPASEAALLIALGKGVDAGPDKPLRVAEPRPVRTASLRPASQSGDLLDSEQEGSTGSPSGRRRRGIYDRRDLRAEDE